MQNECVYVSKPECWAPGINSTDDWLSWANEEKSIEQTNLAPKLEFTSPLFRRRLGQLCKMTVQVVHDVLQKNPNLDVPLVFSSNRGEIDREFTVNRTLIEDSSVLPAAFSLSVFNAPIALASIAFSLKRGYSVIFPSKENFSDTFKTACAPILCGDEKELLFVYGDELIPQEYGVLRPQNAHPLAFATIISAQKKHESDIKYIPFEDKIPKDSEEFLKSLLKLGNANENR